MLKWPAPCSSVLWGETTAPRYQDGHQRLRRSLPERRFRLLCDTLGPGCVPCGTDRVRVKNLYAEDDRADVPERRTAVMPSPAPGADQLAGGVEDDTAPDISARPGVNRAWWWAGASVFLLVLVVLSDAYLHLSKTYMENSDEANILLMAHDMLHGNLYLTGWNTSDVPCITTELPAIAVAMLLAKGSARGPQAIMRMALVLAIMLAPQPGVGVFVLVFSVGHIGTAAPVMLTWLVLDRFGLTTRAGIAATLRQRWYIPLIVAVLIAWALMADPLVLIVAIYPPLVVCLGRLIAGSVGGARHGGGLRGLRQGLAARWLELSLAAAAGIGYLLVWFGGHPLTRARGHKAQGGSLQRGG